MVHTLGAFTASSRSSCVCRWKARVPGGQAMKSTTFGFFGIAHVDGGDAVREAVADVGVTAVHHDLHAVAAAAEVGMADELDIARGDGVHAALSHSGDVRR